jgi:hypothetical protein
MAFTSESSYYSGTDFVYVREARVQRILVEGSPLVASLEELSKATALPIEALISLLMEAQSPHTLQLESIEGEGLFLLTAPLGRPVQTGQPNIATNLWEFLRRPTRFDEMSPQAAFALWKLYREMERAGWLVEPRPGPLYNTLANKILNQDKLSLGIYWRGTLVPLILYPTPQTLSSPKGPLTRLYQQQISLLGVICAAGTLDVISSATREWLLKSRYRANVILLEEPNYLPVLLSHEDGSLTPFSRSKIN